MRLRLRAPGTPSHGPCGHLAAVCTLLIWAFLIWVLPAHLLFPSLLLARLTFPQLVFAHGFLPRRSSLRRFLPCRIFACGFLPRLLLVRLVLCHLSRLSHRFDCCPVYPSARLIAPGYVTANLSARFVLKLYNDCVRQIGTDLAQTQRPCTSRTDFPIEGTPLRPSVPASLPVTP